MTEILFATNNAHKLTEVRSLLGPDFRIISLSELNYTGELPETHDTFEGNASQKAKYIYDRFGVPCFADDSGLEVDALKGAPGVRSARYAGVHGEDKQNIKLLLYTLMGITNRLARFRTVIAFIDDAHSIQLFEGMVTGSIIDEERGLNGFGYDPVFIPEGYSSTFAEMTHDEKNRISHRARATLKLTRYLKEKFV